MTFSSTIDSTVKSSLGYFFQEVHINELKRLEPLNCGGAKHLIRLIGGLIEIRSHILEPNQLEELVELKDLEAETGRRENYLTVTAAVRELEKIELIRQMDKV